MARQSVFPKKGTDCRVALRLAMTGKEARIVDETFSIRWNFPTFHDKKLLFHYKNDEKDENSVLIKIVLIYRGSAYGRNHRKNRGEVYTKRTH